ncbi:TlpA family protein disulfide reductase [Trujillonella humicola]|uniref:TlpA family protein disulfide reductase n=1 Tax=Trujillonella humicola TaxID=3383699 RepID=UPI003906AECA
MRRAIAAAALAAVVVLAGCTGDGEDAPGGPPGSGFGDTVLGACAEQPDRPAAGAQTLPDLQLECPGGGALDLGRALGEPTVVNLWASWCGPCREELPLVQGLADRAGDRLGVVGVISRDGAPQAEAFAEEAGATFPSAFDGDGDLMAELGIGALPYTYFLDAEGGIAHVQVGPVRSVDELVALVAEHLGVQL